MQKYKEINGNDYVKNSRTTINETMQSIQSTNSGTAFPTNNLFEGMKCYRTDLKKTYTLTDVENNTWVEDAHASLSDEATHAASATKLDTARSLNLGGAVTADAATFDGTANATINVKTLDATKLNGTASVSTTGNAATATKVVATAAAGASANIAEAKMATNDLARIRVSGTANAGELALETTDDGSEPIVARQYTGVYTTPVRTAKILDESGNTSFPGTVVAPKFTGSLNGNAATATKLQTLRTLSLTGKAAGSATFDGSANAAINVTSVNADTASKLSTARKINITGNASGSATFDGSADANISVTVNESKHAAAADSDGNGANIANTYVKKAGDTVSGDLTVSGNLYAHKLRGGWDGYCHAVDWGYETHDRVDFYEYGGIWNFWQNTNTDTAGGTLCGSIKSTGWNGNVVGNVTGNADTATNADKLDNFHAESFFHDKGSWNDDIWNTNGAYAFDGKQPDSQYWYNYGSVLSFSAGNNRFQLAATDFIGGDGRLHYRTGYGNRKNGWATILDSNNYNNFAPKKDGTGATGTWGISVSGNATTASKLASPRTISLTGNASGSANFDGSGNISINTNVNYAGQAAKLAGESGNNYLEINTTTNNWNVLGSNPGVWLKSIRTNASAPPYSIGNFSAAVAFGGGDTKGIITHAYDGPNVKFAGGDGSTAQWKFSIYGGRNNETYDLNNFPTKTGGGASGTWGINITGNADTVDGYHASDLFRHLGGNQAPVITDIFDRAGTIDMTTMSAADKATHKANINKAGNATQNIWNTDTGIHAYGGDYDMANGYSKGALKLTQSYKNFDKILVVGSNDDGNILIYRMWDVWELAYMFANSYRFFLVNSDADFWTPYGTTKHGNTTRVWSTDTIWNCENQNSGIVAIYGIKY